MVSKLLKRDYCYGDGGGLSLPEDIILEVLLRLPAKALYRFRCVSRSWRALITDPSFAATLRSRATGKVIVAVFGHELRLLDKGGNVLMVFDVMVFDNRGRRALLAPTCLDHIFVDRGQLGAMIISPASRHDLTIVCTNDPPPPSWANSSVITDYSFGRATVSGDYKVVRLTTSWYYFQPNLWCQVATIMDGGTEPTWRQRPWCPFDGLSRKDKATANGVLYFMLDNTHSESQCRKRIVAFDLESEDWKPEVINGPLLGQKNKDYKSRITLTELMGTLCLVHTIQYLADLVGHYADIWLLKNPNKSVWVKEYKIHMPERLLLSTKPLGVSTDGRLLLLNEFWKAGNNNNCRRYIIQLYNSSTKAVTDFMEMPPGFSGEIAFYTGSLKS